MPRSWTALRTFDSSFSNGNSGVCTPMITRPYSLYFSFQALMYGSVRRQLIQEYVQKSTRTTFPRRDAGVSAGELIHAVAPERSGSMGGAVPGPMSAGLVV